MQPTTSSSTSMGSYGVPDNRYLGGLSTPSSVGSSSQLSARHLETFVKSFAIALQNVFIGSLAAAAKLNAIPNNALVTWPFASVTLIFVHIADQTNQI